MYVQKTKQDKTKQDRLGPGVLHANQFVDLCLNGSVALQTQLLFDYCVDH